MRIALLLPPVLALALAACQRGEPSVPNARTDGAGAAGVAHLPSPAPPAARRTDGVPLEPDLERACTDAMHIVRTALELSLARDTATTFVAPREGLAPWHGCRMTASSTGVPKDSVRPVTPGGLLQAAFLADAWKDDFDYGADGVDGTELGMRKGNVLCHLAIQYNGIEVSDDPSIEIPPDKLPKAFPYTLVVRCTRNPPPLPS